MEHLEAVVFDWAGTTVDYGCFAPLKGFLDGFAAKGVNISIEEARGPMGLLKIDHMLTAEMEKLHLHAIVPEKWQSVIITTFALDNLDFHAMYDYLKQRGFVIYPGKLTEEPTFRIGTIGDLYPEDFMALCACLHEYLMNEESRHR